MQYLQIPNVSAVFLLLNNTFLLLPNKCCKCFTLAVGCASRQYITVWELRLRIYRHSHCLTKVIHNSLQRPWLYQHPQIITSKPVSFIYLLPGLVFLHFLFIRHHSTNLLLHQVSFPLAIYFCRIMNSLWYFTSFCSQVHIKSFLSLKVNLKLIFPLKLFILWFQDNLKCFAPMRHSLYYTFILHSDLSILIKCFSDAFYNCFAHSARAR